MAKVGAGYKGSQCQLFEPAQCGHLLQLEQEAEEQGEGAWDHRQLASFLHKLPELRGGEEVDTMCLSHLLLWRSA